MKKIYYKIYCILCLLIFSAVTVFGQTGSITGRVLDDVGLPVPGTTIAVEGTSIAASTDGNGYYIIKNISNGTYNLKAQFIGFATQTLSVTVNNAATIVNFSLKQSATSLDEVVIVGYGTLRKTDVTGSISTVTTKDFNKGSVTNPEQLIAGKVAGVQVLSSGGAPGASTRILIRGGASLNASNDPLFVIDGVPVDNNGIAGLANPLSTINQQDIESITIQKDASAAAIYGNRASNGVVIITTKKGASGGNVKAEFNTLQSLSNKIGIVDVLNAQEYKYALGEYVKSGKGNPASLAYIGNANTNWQDAIYQQAFKTDNTVSFSGGVKWLPYRLSVGYLDEDGILKTSNFNRISGALNINPKFFNNHLSVNINIKGTLTKSRFANNGAIGAAIAFNPTQPVYAPNVYDASQPTSATNYHLGGYFEWVDPNGTPVLLATKNPLSMLLQEINTSKANRSLGNLQLDYKFHFLPELHANLNLGYDISESDGRDAFYPTLASVYATKGQLSYYWQDKKNKLMDFYLNYAKDLSAIQSHIDVTAGYSYQDWLRNTPGMVIKTNTNPDVVANPSKTQNTMISYFGRVNYSFKDRYALTATMRADGSSRFSKDNRWGYFPSAAFAWSVNKEAFLENSTTVSDLKLRLGYGKTGQQDIVSNDYPYLAKYNQSATGSLYPFGDTWYTMLRPDAYDENIKWEETSQYNIGLDYGFANNRIYGSIDYFIKKTNDLISVVAPPAGSNFKNLLTTNVGNIEAKGIEFNINVNALKTKNFNWSFNFNATHYDNKVTNLTLTGVDDPVGVPISTSFTGESLQYNTVGYAPFTYYVKKQLYGEDGKPLEGQYADLDGDGKGGGEGDFYHYKSYYPDVLLGFTNNLTFKKATLSFTLRSNLGGYNYNSIAAGTGNGSALAFANFLGNASGSIRDTRFLTNQQYSDIYVEKASFLRIDNANLVYNFGKVSNNLTLALQANVQNVFLISGYSGLDPEITNNGIDVNVYPRPRIYSVGVNVGF
ncbi:SusC/RagA family TonB-linked outer membrane protein [Mucilaginibacter limnophilus]|uniref:SusC/RagA family TonB-linked outer membrane protein n=1 Tax=Mucilaginibacter limnophilus TaxID=1932778 RepID=A0A3S2V0F4_9SPHI|nr:SusC/RagA family TonB-linked outer membrane protein [Mucilaginibacter limnophilus]RVT99772.1 SusC/RagA family TonB-linked outer membrane protein [Mucilaginibacter limnophilus]